MIENMVNTVALYMLHMEKKRIQIKHNKNEI